MLKKFFAAMLAIIASTTLFADITLETAALPGAQLIITADSALLKDSLFMNYMEKAREAQKELVGEYGELYKKFEMMLPPGAKNNDKSLIAIASSKLNGTMDEIMAADVTPEDASFIGAVSYPVSVKDLFDAAAILPMDPGFNEHFTLTPLAIADYKAYEIVSKDDMALKVAVVLSKDGKTILFGTPDAVKAQLTAAKKFDAEAEKVLAQLKGNAAGVAFILPEGIRNGLKEAWVDDASFDAAIRDALSGIKTLGFTANSTAATIDVALLGITTTAEQADVLKKSLIDVQVIPMAQGLVPMFIEGASFGNTLASTANADVVKVSVSFTEADITACKAAFDTLNAADEIEMIEEETVEEMPADAE